MTKEIGATGKAPQEAGKSKSENRQERKGAAKTKGKCPGKAPPYAQKRPPENGHHTIRRKSISKKGGYNKGKKNSGRGQCARRGAEFP